MFTDNFGKITKIHKRTDGTRRGALKMTVQSRASTYMPPRSQALDHVPTSLEGMLKHYSKKLVDNTNFTVICTFLTVFALFGEDVRAAAAPAHFDIIFDALIIVALAIFSLEVVVSSLGKEEYYLSFFFVLDCIATVTLVMDITPVAQSIYGPSEIDQEDKSQNSSTFTEATRASRAGGKMGRVVRVIRFIRIVKLYKAAVEARARREREKKKLLEKIKGKEEGSKFRFIDDEEDFDFDEIGADSEKQKAEDAGTESRVSKKLTERTVRTVILLVLTMMFVVPMLDPKQWYTRIQKSPQFQADSVSYAFQEMIKHDDLGTDTDAYRKMYELTLLNTIYRHNHAGWRTWDTSNPNPNSYDFLHGLFFIGHTKTEQLADSLPVQYYNDTDMWDLWFNGLADGPFKNNFTSGFIPEDTKRKFLMPWDDHCTTGSFRGILISDEGCDDLRWSEYEIINPFFERIIEDEEGRSNFIFLYDIRWETALEAKLNIVQTIFICVVLTAGAMVISWDTNRLVLYPIEQMIAKMDKIRVNPLVAMKMGEEEFKNEESSKGRYRGRNTLFQTSGNFQLSFGNVIPILKDRSRRLISWVRKPKGSGAENVEEPMETLILEKTIIKLGSLLALGFGEAGAEIIGHNMSGSQADVNAMIPGKKVEAIFGFCYIRNFTDATEILQDKVMVFVNQIGEIVHSIVDEYHGAPNKNIGDAFLLVWRIRALEDEPNDDRVRRFADMSIMSFVKVIGAINRSQMLAEYRQHPGLLARLPKYRLRMGFGLHFGPAIEGAIGSVFKIDASYLSPNVNIASRLEAATKQFGLSLLMSHVLIEKCSASMKEHTRSIDIVRVKGSKIPIQLYTVDLDYMILRKEVLPKNQQKLTRRRKYEVRQAREMQRIRKLSDEYNCADNFLTDPDTMLMRKMYPKEFYERFSMGFLNYIAGQWQVACNTLEHTRFMLRTNQGLVCEDIPSSTLLRFMNGHNNIAPADWHGVRSLTEK